MTGIGLTTFGVTSATASSRDLLEPSLYDDPVKAEPQTFQESTNSPWAQDVTVSATQAVTVDVLEKIERSGYLARDDYLCEMNVMQSCRQTGTMEGPTGESDPSSIYSSELKVEYPSENETDFTFRDDHDWMKGWSSETASDGPSGFASDAAEITAEWGIDMLQNTLGTWQSVAVDSVDALASLASAATEDRSTETYSMARNYQHPGVAESHLFRRFTFFLNPGEAVDIDVTSSWVAGHGPSPEYGDAPQSEVTVKAPCPGCYRTF